MQVPFVDLRSQHQALRHEINDAIQRVLDRANFVLGDDIEGLEQEFAAFCGTRHAVGLSSGLAALELALRAYGIGVGDEVIVPAHTFTATAAAVSFCGATPVFVDVDPVTFNISVSEIKAAITSRTRAIIPVHLYGLPADMDAIMALARQFNLVVLEDACQAHGAVYKGRRTGSLGHIAAFSFYPTKNLGAVGDAGIVVTDDDQVADTIRAMRNCGQKTKNVHELMPFNARLDTLQAAILRVKLPHLEVWNQGRRRAAALYNQLLTGLRTPTECPDSTHVYHLYVIRTDRRDEMREFLQSRGIGTAIHYPLPVHKQPFFQNGAARYLPEAETLTNEIVSLPMFPEITEEQVRYVADNVLEFAAVAQP